MRKLPLYIIAIIALAFVVANVRLGAPDAEAPVSQAEDTPPDEAQVPESPTPAFTDTTGPEDDDSPGIAVYTIGDKALCFRSFGDGQRYGLHYGQKPLAYDPTTHVDSLSPHTFAIDLMGRRKVFDARHASCIGEVKAFMGPMEGFKRFDKDYVEHIDTVTQETVYMLTLDYPDTTVAQRADIMEWLAGLLDRSQAMDVCVPWQTNMFSGYSLGAAGGDSVPAKDFDIASLGRTSARGYFKDVRREYAGDMPPGAYLTVDYRARALNDRFVTYRSFVHYHEWLGHGMMAEYLHSYDLKNRRPVDYDYLFKRGTHEKVKRLLCAVIAADTTYTRDKNLEPTAEGVEQWIGWWNDNVRLDNDGAPLGLTDPGLTDSGIVFSFQPYEIDCFAAGSWHFTIPYAKARPYMTEQAISMLGI